MDATHAHSDSDLWASGTKHIAVFDGKLDDIERGGEVISGTTLYVEHGYLVCVVDAIF